MIRTLDITDFIDQEKGNAPPLKMAHAAEISTEAKNIPMPKEDEGQSLLNENEIRLFLSRSIIFASLEPEEMSKMVKNFILVSFKKESEIIKSCSKVEDRFYIIKKGQVKVVMADGRRNPVSIYLEEGDFFGETSLIYDIDNIEVIISLTDVELLAIDRNSFKDHYNNYPNFRKAIINRVKERGRHLTKIENNSKASSVMNFMIENGLTYATKLKIYEMNKCINCLSCVKACKERHGLPRFKRVGARYSFVNVPQSCRACKYPTCLGKCRKDAISREKNGEIVINSNCVGCGLCAKSCSFGAIEVIELEDAPNQTKKKRMAIKCDHCREYNSCACVSECPTGAMKHVEPKNYFKPLFVD